MTATQQRLLVFIANLEEIHGRGKAHPRLDSMASAIGAHRTTVIRNLQALESCGHLVQRKRSTRAGKQLPSNYELTESGLYLVDGIRSGALNRVRLNGTRGSTESARPVAPMQPLEHPNAIDQTSVSCRAESALGVAPSRGSVRTENDIGVALTHPQESPITIDKNEPSGSAENDVGVASMRPLNKENSATPGAEGDAVGTGGAPEGRPPQPYYIRDYLNYYERHKPEPTPLDREMARLKKLWAARREAAS